jgi:RNA polymerase sigma-70 factor (ECF subfamily)
MSDEEAIIRRVLDGDVQAFREIVERYQRPVFRVVSNLLFDRAEAEDVTQDVFLTAFTRLPEYKAGRAPLATWLFVIARNKCLNAVKRRRPSSAARAPEPVDLRTPEESLDRQEWYCRFDAALAALPFDQRTAFVLAELEELPYDQIARMENVPLGTVKSRVARAKEKLRQLLEPTKIEP